MPYLIDGHNLIPKMPGLSLEDPDDEIQLIELLQDFCRRRRKEVEVYFDNAPAGMARNRKFGLVSARFIRQGTTADEAIRHRLQRLGREAKNWIVVSSDLAVQSAARSARSPFLSAETFAALLLQTLAAPEKDAGEQPQAPLSAQELEDWLRLFGSDEAGK
jgi:predicted RNA-binding protein with PIN domain